MKKLIAFAFIVLNVFSAVYAFDNFSFSATPSVGVTSGVVREYVMHDKTPASRLDWITFANPTFQIDANVFFYNAFLEADASVNIPMRCGMMEDRDWEDLDGLLTSPADYVVIYSKHDMDLKSRFHVSGKLGYKFDIQQFSVAPFAGIKYVFHSFDGLNGYQQKAEKPLETGLNGDEPHSADYNVKVISYEQSLLLPSVGANFSCAFTQKLIAYLGLTFYPYMMINAVDKHYYPDGSGKGYVFYDTMRGGFGLMIDAAVEYNKFVFKFEYESVFHYAGQTRSGSIGTSYPDATPSLTPMPHDTPVHGSGTDSFLFKLSVGYKIN